MGKEGTKKSVPNPGDVQAGTTPATSRWFTLGNLQRLVGAKPPKTQDSNLVAAEAAAKLKNDASLVLKRFLTKELVLPTQAKKIIKAALETKLKTSIDTLKTKVKNTKHQQIVSDIQELIRAQFNGLAFKPTKEKLGDFNGWFDKMLDSKKNAFPEDNWVWHDIIKPALMILAGVLFTLLTAAIRPFVEGINTYANLFFVKPDSDGFSKLKQAALEMKADTESSLGLGA